MKFNKDISIEVSENEVTRVNELYEKMYKELICSVSENCSLLA